MKAFTIVSSILNEKAKSKSQQRLFGMVHAVQKGTIAAPTKNVEKIAKTVSPKEVMKFATTKTKNLPEKVKQEETDCQ